MGVTRIMHNSPNRGVNYHIFQNKGNHPVILVFAMQMIIMRINLVNPTLTLIYNLVFGDSSIG